MLPLPSATQLAESMVKNANFCKSTGKDEANTSNLAMIRSVNITSVNSAIKESDQFRNRKRRNEELPDYLHNQLRNAKALAETCSRKREGAGTSNNKTNCICFLNENSIDEISESIYNIFFCVN